MPIEIAARPLVGSNVRECRSRKSFVSRPLMPSKVARPRARSKTPGCAPDRMSGRE